MKTIVSIILLAIALASCSDEQFLVKDIETAYSFSINAADQKEFTAQIVWSVDGQNGYTENIKSTGYGSAFDLAKNEVFIVMVTSNKPLSMTIQTADGQVAETNLESGKSFTFKK